MSITGKILTPIFGLASAGLLVSGATAFLAPDTYAGLASEPMGSHARSVSLVQLFTALDPTVALAAGAIGLYIAHNLSKE